MNLQIGENILRYRKEKKWSQARLAQELDVSFQAISKWENNLSYPETHLIPRIASCLNISCDTLLGHHPSVPALNTYESLYQSEEYYWGTQPTALSLKVLSYLPPVSNPTLLDLGCREGQNVLFFARNGYRVTGVEISESGVRKGKALARHWNVQADFICASVADYQPVQNFDIVFCDTILHLIKPEDRTRLLDMCKKNTPSGGIHVVNVPVKKPFLSTEQRGQRLYEWKSGELFTCYSDWKILECTETEPLLTTGRVHPRIYNYVIAQKI